jgi:hypothetical protein
VSKHLLRNSTFSGNAGEQAISSAKTQLNAQPILLRDASMSFCLLLARFFTMRWWVADPLPHPKPSKGVPD